MCCEKKIIKGDRNEHKRCCYFPSCLKGAASLTRWLFPLDTVRFSFFIDFHNFGYNMIWCNFLHVSCAWWFLKVKVKSLSRVWLFATPWTVAYQAPPSMGFSRQECWSGLPFPSPGDLPDPGIEPRSLVAGRRFTVCIIIFICIFSLKMCIFMKETWTLVFYWNFRIVRS